MARPKKNNAEYYTHDADMRNDIKVKALRRKFSHMGYAVWNYLLETLTDNDYFEITWDEINIELLAADYDVSVEELTEIVAYCVKIGLLQLENDVLRSDALQNRFNELLDNRVKKSEAGKKGMAKRWGKKDNIVIKSDNSVITPLQKTITENNKGECEPARGCAACAPLPSWPSLSIPYFHSDYQQADAQWPQSQRQASYQCHPVR